jgi:phosphomannomutase
VPAEGFLKQLLTLGTLNYLQSINRIQIGLNQQKGRAIPLAGDLRASTERLLKATAHANLDAGYEARLCGQDTDAGTELLCLAKDGVASFMVAGSHIPTDRNGQKANR